MQPGVGYAVPNQGASHYPPSFSNYYNPNLGQQSFGSQTAAAGVGAIAGAPAFLGTVGVGAGLTQLGAGLLGKAGFEGAAKFAGSRMLTGASMLDPISAGFQVGSRVAGTSAIGGLGAGVLAGTGIAALMYGGYKAASAFSTGASHQAEINRMFADYSFANPAAMSGRGFTAQQLGRIGDVQHGLNMSSSFISGGDAAQLTKQFSEMGLSRGAQSISDITSKLREFGTMADEVAQKMGTSITQVSGLIQKMRGAGFLSASEVSGNVTDMRTAQGLGISNNQYLAAQNQGAANALGMGLTNVAGAKFASNVGSQMVQALSIGDMDQEQMMRLTGTDHYVDAGVQFAGKMQNRMANFLRGGAGKAFLAGIGEVQDGKFTGKIDSSQLSKLSAGGDFDQMMNRGRMSLGSRDAGRSFVTNQDSMIDSLMSSDQGLSSVVGAMTSMAERANLGDDEDAFVLLGKKFQMGTELELRELYKFAQNQDKTRKEILRKKAQELATERFQTTMARKSLSGRTSEFFGGLSDTMLGGIEHAGAVFMTGSMDTYEDINMSVGEYLSGIERDNMVISETGLRDTIRDMATGTNTDIGNDLVTQATVSAYGGERPDGALGNMSGNQALMLHRAASSNNFDDVKKLIGATLSDSVRKGLDDEVSDLKKDPEFLKRLGNARDAKFSGDPSAVAKSVQEMNQYLLGKGVVNNKTESQYLISQAGGTDIVASDLSNAEVSVKEKDSKSRQKEKMVHKLIAGSEFAYNQGETNDLVVQSVGATVGMVGGILTAGAAMSKAGAILGTTVGPAGTAIGAAVGAVVGIGVGLAAAGGLIEAFSSEEQEIIKKMKEDGTGLDLMSALKNPKDVQDFNQILEEYKAAIPDEDEAYEAAAKAFAKKYGRPVSAEDVRTADKAMTSITKKSSTVRSGMSVQDIENDDKLGALLGYAQHSTVAKTKKRIYQSMRDSISGSGMLGLKGEAGLVKAIGQDAGPGREADIQRNIQTLLRSATDSGFTASSEDSQYAQAVAAGAKVIATFDSLEGGISEAELMKKLNVDEETLKYYRGKTGGTGVISKSELNQLSQMMSDATFMEVQNSGVAGTGGFEGLSDKSDAQLQAESVQKTAFMIDALYAKATGTQPSTSGGERVFNQMQNTKPDE